jgi:hypothetical protein
LPKPRRAKSAGKEDKRQAHHDAMSPTGAPATRSRRFAVIRLEPSRRFMENADDGKRERGANCRGMEEAAGDPAASQIDRFESAALKLAGQAPAAIRSAAPFVSGRAAAPPVAADLLDRRIVLRDPRQIHGSRSPRGGVGLSRDAPRNQHCS